MNDIEKLIAALREHASEAWDWRYEPGPLHYDAAKATQGFANVADWIENVYLKELVPDGQAEVE